MDLGKPEEPRQNSEPAPPRPIPLSQSGSQVSGGSNQSLSPERTAGAFPDLPSRYSSDATHPASPRQSKATPAAMSGTPSSDAPSLSASSSFVIADLPHAGRSGRDEEEEDDDVDSLPSISTSILESEADSSDAQREWEASLEQLQLLLTMIIMPFAGKFLGRKFAYWSAYPASRPRLGASARVVPVVYR